jgi:hypothetical protein
MNITDKTTGKEKVLNFIDMLKAEQEKKDQMDAFKNSDHYKLRVMDRMKDDAKDKCLNNICGKIYKDAIPLNDEYKRAYCDDLDQAWSEFIAKRCPQGIEYYVKEGLKKGSPFAKKVLEAVNELVNNEYRDMEVNPDKYSPDELVFKSTDDVQKKLDVINSDLGTDELSQAIQDNVKSTVMSEINRAKAEKERISNLERELANDVHVNTPEAVESALEAAGVTEKKFYEPSLFEAINIGMLNTLKPRFESGELQSVYLYDTLADFNYEKANTEDITENANVASLNELAFVEAVKELTALNVIKALKLENFNPINLKDVIYEYASMR